jgi:hypothetical protein
LNLVVRHSLSTISRSLQSRHIRQKSTPQSPLYCIHYSTNIPSQPRTFSPLPRPATVFFLFTLVHIHFEETPNTIDETVIITVQPSQTRHKNRLVQTYETQIHHPWGSLATLIQRQRSSVTKGRTRKQQLPTYRTSTAFSCSTLLINLQ